MKITIIHLEDDMLISKENFESWRQIQDEFENYQASLGPWSAQEVIEHLNDEYTNLNPKPDIQVSNLLSDSKKIQRLTFND